MSKLKFWFLLIGLNPQLSPGSVGGFEGGKGIFAGGSVAAGSVLPSSSISFQ